MKEGISMTQARAGKLQRISDEAAKYAKIAAAIEDVTMEVWCSAILIREAKKVRFNVD